MGVYIYAMSTVTRSHPTHGEVGVLYFLLKVAPVLTKEAQWNDAKKARVRRRWAGRTIPRVVVFDHDPDTYYDYTGGCLWNDDAESHRLTPIPSPPPLILPPAC